ncbi:MAG: insulinase family protein [Kiritimatiellae bacterium]|nr:insulinase family protein [Kiritimatiellia bacterium]
MTAHQTLRAGERIHGFTVNAVDPLPELKVTAIRATHDRSGAQLLHLHGGDTENLMAIGFRTPPCDSTGLPHILEHTVLCGSRRYPVKDPFVELLKTSLATFLNAFTYPDRTVYPCASMNHRDFFNAASVYLDAVFHPNLTEMHFKQEGHHFDFERKNDPASPLTVSGIVYNEMKGVYSSLDGCMWRATEALYPDTPYGFDSGGDPEVIPSLTYEQFVGFHRRYYHPSNARIFLYGDIPTRDHLAFLDREALAAYERIEMDSAIPAQPRWTAPRRVTIPYPAAAGDRPEEKSAFALAWMCGELIDAATTYAWEILGAYLLGHEGSPLHKALMDSGLGGEVAFSGHIAHRRQTMFAVGLKETSPDRADDVEKLVRENLERIAADGLDPDRLESCFHQFEIGVRSLPQNYPLVLMERVFDAWTYDADPLVLLRARDHLADLRRRASDPGYFPRLIREGLLENTHMLAMLFVPDDDLTARRDRENAARFAGVKSGMSAADLDRIAREAVELDAMQAAPNTPEALATLPRLHPSDVPVEPPALEIEHRSAAGRPWESARLFTNGLSHLSIAIDLSGLEEEEYPWVPLYAEALTGMGAAGRGYDAMAEREAAASGGISARVGLGGHFHDPARSRPFLFLSASCLDERAERMLDVLGERWFQPDFHDPKRLKDIIVQEAIRRRESVAEHGNAHAGLYAARGLSAAAFRAEQFGGITQARLMRSLAERVGRESDAIEARLIALHRKLRGAWRVHAAFAGGEAAEEIARARMESWLAAAPAEPEPDARALRRDAAPSAVPAVEGIAVPAGVAFVAEAFPAVPAADPRAPALLVLSNQLTFGYLWSEVRVRRGAYGCSARYDQGLGQMALSSFRDPCIAETLETYRGIARHVLRDMDLAPEAVDQQVIGAFKSLDAPMRPARAVSLALSWHLTGVRDEDRAAFRARLRATRAEDLRRAAAEIIEPALSAAPVAIVAGREKLEAARTALPALRIEEF